MIDLLFHPAIPFLAAGLLALTPNRIIRNAAVVVAPVVSFYFLNYIQHLPPLNFNLLTYNFQLIYADKLSLLFTVIFITFGLFANIYALHTNSRLIFSAGNLYLGSSIGAVLSGDLVTLFVFWEIMAITSCFLIYNQERKSSFPALYRYLLTHLTGGLFFFSGLLMMLLQGKGTGVQTLNLDLAGGLIFLGFALNAGLPPLHAWLPDAYPEGRPSGSVFMSALTTKVAVFAFARYFLGAEILIYIGAFAAVYGVIYALMENDMRRLLSYHIVCQIGYMLCGIGMGDALGYSAGVGHAIGNILFKGLLFMATGAIIYRTGKYKLTELGGLYHLDKKIFALYMIGALAISGLPGLNGYVTKALLIDAAIYAHLVWLEWLLLIVAAGTFMSIGLKLAYFAFFGKQTISEKETKPLPTNMLIAMIGVAFGCVWIGILPDSFIHALPAEIHKNPFTAKHVIYTLELILATFLGFILILPKLHLKDKISLDVDWFYRIGASAFVNFICVPIKKLQETIQEAFSKGVVNLGENIQKFDTGRIEEVRLPLLWITCASFVVGIFIFASQAF